MAQNRRSFLSMAALSAGAVTLSSQLYGKSVQKTHSSFDMPTIIENLQPMTDGIVPITEAERKQRIAKAQQLMDQNKMDAIFLEGTVSCYYFTGMRWGQSERTFGIVIPSKGSISYICPKFEEDRAMELINPAFGTKPLCCYSRCY
jgi:Xaa-Pro dipeptidase